MPDQDAHAEALKAVRTLIAYIGDVPDRPGLVDTPERFLRAWKECWGVGYEGTPYSSLIRMFSEEGEGSYQSQMVVVRKISFFSTCEHHLAPFFGGAAIAYIPVAPGTYAPTFGGQPRPYIGGVVGLSKLARVVNHFARQLQVQERLTRDIASFLAMHVSPHVAVELKALHMCAMSRGVEQAHMETRTTEMRGEFMTDPATRAEFLQALNQ